MFKKIENKIKEIAIKINKSKVLDWEETYNDAKEIFELAVIYKHLSKFWLDILFWQTEGDIKGTWFIIRKKWRTD